VVEDVDKGEAIAKLLDYAQRVAGTHKDLAVLPTGERPDGRPVKNCRVEGNTIEFCIAGEPVLVEVEVALLNPCSRGEDHDVMG
jgi:hypothetical protein